jgi:hypothetical protein
VLLQTWELASSLQQQESLAMAQDRKTLPLVVEGQVQKPMVHELVAPLLAAGPSEQRPQVAVGQVREPVAQHLSTMLRSMLALVDCRKHLDSPAPVSSLLSQQQYCSQALDIQAAVEPKPASAVVEPVVQQLLSLVEQVEV